MNRLVDWAIVNNEAVSVLKGQKLHAHDFAYTPDLDEPSTWKLRIDDARHVAGAIAALGKGFRGERVQIPAGERAAVKAKVLRAWHKYHKGQKPPEVLNMLNYNADRDDDDDDEEDEDESGDLTKNSKDALHHSHKALIESSQTDHHLSHTVDAHEASKRADSLKKNKEAHHQAATAHEIAARHHKHHAELYEHDSEHHKKAAHHHKRAKQSHEEAMSHTTNNELLANAKKYHKMSDEELDGAHKELLAEKNRRMMNGFMGLTYQNPGRETPSAEAGEAYEFQNPEDIDWDEELEGLGLSHNEAASIQNLLGSTKPTDNRNWWSQVPDEYKEAMKVAAQTANRERGVLLQQLTTNMSEEHRNIAINKWKKLPIDELRQMVSMFVGNQQQQSSAPPSLDPIFLGGAGGASFVGNQQQLGDDAMILPTQNTDWDALSKENRSA